MGIFSIFSGEKAAEKALDITDKATTGLINGIDKVFYTEEEKAETALKRAEIALKVSDAHIKLMETLGSENTVRSITRRYLAVMIIGTFLLLLVLSAAVWKWFPDWAVHIFQVATTLSTLSTTVGIFYFGYYGLKEAFKAGKGK
jgi:hypothetical protein